MKTRLDLGIYLRAIPLLVRNPSIVVLPILAAVGTLVFDQLARLTTDPLGGAGFGIWQMLEQLLFGFCFAGAILGASNILRKRPGGFDAMWLELRDKTGSVLLAVLGFYFIVYAGQFIGASLLGNIGGIGIQLLASFFLIYTIPAAVIGGFPAQLALSASIRCVRANVAAALILAAVFVTVYALLPPYILIWIVSLIGGMSLPGALYAFIPAVFQAIAIAYLAFPFAAMYDDVAFSNRY